MTPNHKPFPPNRINQAPLGDKCCTDLADAILSHGQVLDLISKLKRLPNFIHSNNCHYAEILADVVFHCPKRINIHDIASRTGFDVDAIRRALVKFFVPQGLITLKKDPWLITDEYRAKYDSRLHWLVKYTFTAVKDVIRNFLNETLGFRLPSIWYLTPYHKDGNCDQHLQQFLSSKGLDREWSSKRNGWVIPCPGKDYHGHKTKHDDFVLTTYKKPGSNFVYISAKCRHESCQEAQVAYCKHLNMEWGSYLSSKFNPRRAIIQVKPTVEPMIVMTKDVSSNPKADCVLKMEMEGKYEQYQKEKKKTDRRNQKTRRLYHFMKNLKDGANVDFADEMVDNTAKKYQTYRIKQRTLREKFADAIAFVEDFAGWNTKRVFGSVWERLHGGI